MASPRVFISSTCYDLKYIRENLKYFIKTIGYEPILSEEGSVFFDPKIHTHDACLNEVPNCQLFVLIIGGRFGGKFKDSDMSITNAEFKEAKIKKIPIFSLVEQAVHSDHYVYRQNLKNSNVNAQQIQYPSVDNYKIFEFMDEVRLSSINNALVPFHDFNDIENYLRQQWAGMMFSFLSQQNEEKRFLDTVSAIQEVNQRVEMLSRQILKSVGTDDALLTTELYESMLASECIRDLSWLNLKPTPKTILSSTSYADLAKRLGRELIILESDEYTLNGSGEMSRPRYESNSKLFEKLQKELKDILRRKNIPLKSFLKDIER